MHRAKSVTHRDTERNERRTRGSYSGISQQDRMKNNRRENSPSTDKAQRRNHHHHHKQKTPCFASRQKDPYMHFQTPEVMQSEARYHDPVQCHLQSCSPYRPDALRDEGRFTLPTLPLVLRTPPASLLRRLSPLRLGLPRTLLRVLEPLPDFMVPGVFGRGAAGMFSRSLLLSLSIEV